LSPAPSSVESSPELTPRYKPAFEEPKLQLSSPVFLIREDDDIGKETQPREELESDLPVNNSLNHKLGERPLLIKTSLEYILDSVGIEKHTPKLTAIVG
jgi:hypothetical protein